MHSPRKFFHLLAGVGEATIVKQDINDMLTKAIPLAVIVDSETLFNICTGFPGRTEKRLLMEIQCVRENISGLNINEFAWCKSEHMVADAMRKITPNDALEKYLSTGVLHATIQNHIKRDEAKTKSIFDMLSSSKKTRM